MTPGQQFLCCLGSFGATFALFFLLVAENTQSADVVRLSGACAVICLVTITVAIVGYGFGRFIEP